MALTMAEVARDYETDGVPSSGPHKIKKNNLRGWGAWVEGLINAFTSNGGLIFASKASLDASLNYAANSMAWVLGDATVANNGVYRKIGGSGTGSWTRVSDLPFSFIIASDVGAGTANAIQATTSIPVSSSALVWMNVFEANTASPVTVSFNGGSALTIKTNTANNVAAGGLVAGMIVLGIVSGSTFRLVSDQASASIVAAAEAAQAAAELARDDAEAAAASINQRIYTTLANAQADTIPSAVKRLKTQFYAPNYAVPSTLAGGADYRRASFADISAYPTQTYFRSQDRFMPDGTTDATNGGYWVIDARELKLSSLGAVESSAADAAPLVTAAIQYQFLRGGGEVVADGLYNIQTSVSVPTPSGDPIATQFWTTKVVFRGLGDGTGLRAGTSFPADTVMINMPGPMDIRDMRLDGNGKGGVIGHDLTYITGFARSEFRRIHYIGFNLTNSKCFRTKGHTWLFDDCNFERSWAGIWVDNFGINCVIQNCNFTANGNSFAQIYLGQNTAEGVPQGLVITGNMTTGGGYGLLCRAMYVLNLHNNIFDNTVPGGTNAGVGFLPQATTDVVTGLPLQPICAHLQIRGNWIAGGRPIASEPPPGSSLIIGQWCHTAVIDDNIFPQSAPVFIGSNVVGGIGAGNGGVYNIRLGRNTYVDQQGSNTFKMLRLTKVTDVVIRDEIFEWCSWSADQCVDIDWEDVTASSTPAITALSGKVNGWSSFTPNAAASVPGGTPPTFGTRTGRFRKKGTVIDIEMRIPVTTAGTGSGVITINNLPAAPAADVVLTAAEVTAGLSCRAIASAATTTLSVALYDNSYPLGSNGRTLVITGTYECQYP